MMSDPVTWQSVLSGLSTPLASGACAFVGAFLTHRLQSRREREQETRRLEAEKRAQLRECFEALLAGANAVKDLVVFSGVSLDEPKGVSEKRVQYLVDKVNAAAELIPQLQLEPAAFEVLAGYTVIMDAFHKRQTMVQLNQRAVGTFGIEALGAEWDRIASGIDDLHAKMLELLQDGSKRK
jgi:hypothetical protein